MANGEAETPAKGALTAAEKQLPQLDSWKRNASRLRNRNLVTGLAIGAFVVGLFSYTILSVKQEKIMKELDDEAQIQFIRGPRTGANS